ncbi:MAG: phenylalanine--tRNA ligase subunit beta, partial [Bacteroidaceae bacterium]|nr:phenylalanine--tRNA ligase subunit beta [Bacteroidaceae bacterium]
YETTTNVLLESAYFHPTWIRKSARRHGLSTDSSFRFERGIDPTQQVYALKAAAMLVKELAGGKISMDVKDIVARELPQYFEVNLDYKYAHDLIGKEIPVDVIKEIVTSLEMKIVEEKSEGIKLHIPAYRVDVQRPCDVVEDILRIYGYNNVEIPTSVKSSLTIQTDTDRSNKLQNLISEQLVGCGFHEMMNNSLTKEAYYANLKTYALNNLVKLMNPLSSDLNVLRQTLLFGGLESIRHNANRKMANLAFFEFGNCYRYDETRRNPEKALAPYSEDAHLGLWLTGKRIEGSWAHPDEDSSVFELKAYVMNILTRLGVQLKALLIKEGNNDVFSKSLAITDRNGKVYVEFGQVAKAVTAQFDLGSDVYYADLNWTLIMRATRKNTISFKEISKYPAVSRDLALLVDKTVEFAQIEQIAYAAEKKLLKKVTLFDVYEGKNLEPGKKSYAVNFTLQDDQKTMNDKQTDAIMQKIINSLEKQLGAKLR